MSCSPSSNPSFEEQNGSLSYRLQRSVSLESPILEGLQELYKHENSSLSSSNDSDYAADLNLEACRNPHLSPKPSDNFIDSENGCSFPNFVDNFYSNGSSTASDVICGESSKNFKVDVPFRTDAGKDYVVHRNCNDMRSVISTNHNSTENKTAINGKETHSFFQVNKRSSLHRTKSTGNVSDDKNIPSNTNKIFESFFKRKNREHSSSSEEQQLPVKARFRSIWNNMKYGWHMKREVTLKADSAIWLLGKCYHNKVHDGVLFSQEIAKQLKLDVLSKIWLTYRINFPSIPGTNIISDSGWGCMLRCGQMMMAQAFVCHFLDRDWRHTPDQPEEKKQSYRMIVRWFGDTLSEKSPFSLHRLVSFGIKYGRKAGDWYGPTHVAHVLRDALYGAKSGHPELNNLCMYVASDGIVFKQDVIDLCMDSSYSTPVAENHSNSNLLCGSTSTPLNFEPNKEQMEKFGTRSRHVSECEEADEAKNSYTDPCPSYSNYEPPPFKSLEMPWKSLILFVSVRLGNDKINPFYVPCLKSLLAYEHCIGIIGGRPKHALYFIGFQDEKLIHMDPHSCQPAIDVERDDFNEKSFHSPAVRMMSFTEMDPSCAIGFYFQERNMFEDFVSKFSEITVYLDYPVFALIEGKRADMEKISHLSPRGCSFSHNSTHNEDDDYILL